MFQPNSRRAFLKSTAAGAALGVGDLSFLKWLGPVTAAEAKLEPAVVRFDSDIEPLVRLLEDTPRNNLLEKVGKRIRAGTSYREILAALLLAGVRNVQPRPHVGFKFHAVLVVNSAHLASLNSPAEHRWLPIFWALDYFKEAQARDVNEGNWTMQAVDEAALPPAPKAQRAFVTAMENWDEPAADAAVAALARTAGASEIYELMFRLGARDFRDIGHKAIYAANSFRTLNCIGWQYAEPVLRSLAYALLQHDGGNPAKRDDPADRPGRKNVERAQRIRPDWLAGKVDSAVTSEMLATLRHASDDEICDHVVDVLNGGIAPQSIWDALAVGAGELLARQPGIVALHAVTTTNALRFAWDTVASDETRRLLLLQNAAFLTLFRKAMKSRGSVADFKIDELAPAAGAKSTPSVSDIFSDVRRDPASSAGKVLAYLSEHPQPKELIDAARVLVFLKGTNAHDYKFSSAVLEDFYKVSPAWRGRYLATSVFNLHGANEHDNDLVQRTRAALG